MRFAQPLFLWLLVLLMPALIAFFYWAWRSKQKLMTQFVNARLLSTLTVGVSVGRQKMRVVLMLLAVLFLMLAMARPQWGFVWEETKQQGLDIVVAIDTSRSMLAADVPPNRLTRAKLAALDLMKQAKNDRLGLVAFAGTAFLQAPLTLDEEAFRQNVEALDVNIIPQGGTALTEALNTALTAFEKGNDNHKVMVLFTDGEDHDQDAETLAAAEAAGKAGLKIFTIGLGTPEGEMLRAADEHGNVDFVKDDQGNAVKSHLNETLLQKIASVSGGFYLPLRGANPIDTLYSRGLAPLPKSDSATKLSKIYKERFHWPLSFAIVCLLAELFLINLGRNRSIKAEQTPRQSTDRQDSGPSLNTAKPASIAAILAVLLIPATAHASPGSAMRQYKSGNFDKALDEYERLATQKTNDYRLHYNAGTAAYRAKEFNAAQKHLSSALSTPEIASDLDLQQRAYYNLGNTFFQLGTPMPDLKKKGEMWEESVANYERALRLNPKDTDATNNLVFVKKKLEELKKMQQQQKNDKNKDNKDKKDDKENEQNQDQQQQQDKQDQQDKQQNADSKDQQQQQQQQQQQAKQDQKNQKDEKDQKQSQAEQQKKEQQQAQKAKEEKEKQQQQQASAAEKNNQQGETNEQASAAIARMTPQQARQILDAQKQEEKALIFRPETQPRKHPDRRIKNW